MPDAAVAAREQKFNHDIQGARGLFALMVFLFHIHNSKLPAPDVTLHGPGGFALTTLQFGVELFFCISGFVIAGTLRRARSPGRFMGDRAMRILPALWATIAVAVVLGRASGTGDAAGLRLSAFVPILIANLFCLPNVVPLPLFNPAAWSLSYEMTFYLLCAFGWALRRRTGMSTALIAAIPAAAILMFLHPRALFFLVGLAVAEELPRRSRILIAASRHPLVMLAASLGCWGGVWQLTGWRLEVGMAGWWTDARPLLAAGALIAALPFFQGVADGNGISGRLLRLPAMQAMGGISYSFYLWQYPVMGVVKHAMVVLGLPARAGLIAQPLFLVLALPPTLLVAWGSQRILEKRATSWLRRRAEHPQGWFLRKA